MSIESEVKKLTAAVEANTDAIIAAMHTTDPAPVASAPVGFAVPVASAPVASAPAPALAPAPVPVAPAPAPAPVPMASLSVASVNQILMDKSKSIDNGMVKVLECMARFGGAQKLNDIAPDMWPDLITQIGYLQ